MAEFHIRLHDIRVQKGKMLKDVAQHLGVEVRSYQAYESGNREPSITKLIALADFFDVTLDYLMGRTDS